MSETLLNQSAIRLYGRVISDLKLDRASSQGAGATTRLHDQLSENNAQLARIYGFAYDGHYYDMPSPAIFMVHGEGEEVDCPAPEPESKQKRVVKSEVTSEVTAELECETREIRVWTYDKADFSIRLDMETGPLEDILLAATASAEQLFQSSGMKVSGMKVAGMKVAGMKVSGMKVSGMKVSGMKMRGGD